MEDGTEFCVWTTSVSSILVKPLFNCFLLSFFCLSFISKVFIVFSLSFVAGLFLLSDFCFGDFAVKGLLAFSLGSLFEKFFDIFKVL